jgi:excisionase family DNA binding protein
MSSSVPSPQNTRQKAMKTAAAALEAIAQVVAALAEEDRPPERSAEGEPLLRPLEVAKLLALDLSMVYRLARSGDLPAVTVGPKSIRFEPKQVAAYRAAHASRGGRRRRPKGRG